jgi:ABC-type glutathione transport system ATPase component
MAPLVSSPGVGFGYPRPERSREGGFSVTDVSFAIEPGEIFGVIGPNSAGKTTLLRLLTRVVAAERGEIRPGRAADRADGPRRAGPAGGRGPQDSPARSRSRWSSSC